MNDFLAGKPARRAVLGTSLTAGTVAALTACGGGQEPAASPTAAGPTEEATEATTTDKLPVGGRASVDLKGHNYLLYRPDETTVLAYSAVCTHEGCQVGVGSKVFQCPCHGSEFAFADGTRVAGPAKDPLPSYRAVIEGDKVLVYL